MQSSKDRADRKTPTVTVIKYNNKSIKYNNKRSSLYIHMGVKQSKTKEHQLR